jgi:hypothetical protein
MDPVTEKIRLLEEESRIREEVAGIYRRQAQDAVAHRLRIAIAAQALMMAVEACQDPEGHVAAVCEGPPCKEECRELRQALTGLRAAIRGEKAPS